MARSQYSQPSTTFVNVSSRTAVLQNKIGIAYTPDVGSLKKGLDNACGKLLGRAFTLKPYYMVGMNNLGQTIYYVEEELSPRHQLYSRA